MSRGTHSYKRCKIKQLATRAFFSKIKRLKVPYVYITNPKCNHTIHTTHTYTHTCARAAHTT